MEGSEPPELPDNLQYVWNVYCDILKGCERVSWIELRGYEEITGTKLTPWESSVMIELDIERRRNG